MPWPLGRPLLLLSTCSANTTGGRSTTRRYHPPRLRQRPRSRPRSPPKMLVRVRLRVDLLRRRRGRYPPLLVAWPSISMSSYSPLTRTGPSACTSACTCTCTCACTPRLLLLQPGSLPRHMYRRRATIRPRIPRRTTRSCISSAAAARDRRRPPPNERADAQQTPSTASERCMRIGRCCVLPCGGTAAAAAASFGYRPFKRHLNVRLFCLCCVTENN